MKNLLKISLLSISMFAIHFHVLSQQTVYSRAESSSSLWWDGANPWYRQCDGWWIDRPDRSQCNNNTTIGRNDVFIGHNNNTTMTVNGAFFQLRTLTLEASSTANRTFNATEGGGFSISVGLYNNSTGSHTVNIPVGVDGSTVTFDASSGNLTFTSNIYINSNTASFTGNQNTTVSGLMEGTGGKLAKSGSGSLIITNNNTYSGTTTISAGTLELQGNLASNEIIVESGATLRINGTAVTINSLTINAGGIVDIMPGKSLTVSGTLTNNAGSAGLVVSSDETGTGSIIHSTSGVSGTVERYMNNADWTNAQDGWHLISSPVASQAISPNFTTSEYDFYCWYEPTAQWVNFKNTSTEPTWNTANGSTNFTVGRGYMAAYDDGGTKNFTGTLNVADVTFTNLSFNAGTFDGLHLLGNPFSSAVTWYTGWSTSAVGGVAKIWNEAGLSYSSINSGDIIPATQGFFIEVSSGTNAITIPAANRTHSTQAFYKATTYPVIKLTASNLDFPSFQESQIRFNPASTEAFDFEFDGQFFAGYAPLFYSVSDGKNLDVNSLPSVELSLNIPFTFIKNEGDNFSINAELENVSETVFLLDKKTSIDHNLTTNPVYTFTSSENDDPNRFEIHFGLVGINEPDNENPLNAYVYGDRIYVMNSSGSTVLQLFDLQGRMVQSNVLNGSGLQSQSVNLPAGVYVARVNDEKSVKSIKLVIE